MKNQGHAKMIMKDDIIADIVLRSFQIEEFEQRGVFPGTQFQNQHMDTA